MAKQTSKTYRNQVMYSIFVRNYSKEGNFASVKRNLQRIKELGVDIIWLLPIHPIGMIARKGSLGSPYAIRDYRQINPEYGTLEDFRSLVNAIHAHDMKCIIDVVYNHTSPDSWLVQNHPEWFYRTADGRFGNKVGQWLDVIDLDYTKRDLWAYQIETLVQWAEIVDGFRCDVAPLIPLEFWLEARSAVESVRPGCLWLAESVEPEFIVANRAWGFTGLSDGELYQAFDICYDYDIFAYFRGYLAGQNTLDRYVEKINQQEALYPDNYVKLRYLENHDQARAKSLISGDKARRNWLAFQYFQKGMALVYAGQERAEIHLPSLFDKDYIRWERSCDVSSLHKRLSEIKKRAIFTDSQYNVRVLWDDVLYATHTTPTESMVGIFSIQGREHRIPVEIPAGIYQNLIDDRDLKVQHGIIESLGEPIIFGYDRT